MKMAEYEGKVDFLHCKENSVTDAVTCREQRGRIWGQFTTCEVVWTVRKAGL